MPSISGSSRLRISARFPKAAKVECDDMKSFLHQFVSLRFPALFFVLTSVSQHDTAASLPVFERVDKPAVFCRDGDLLRQTRGMQAQACEHKRRYRDKDRV